LKKPEEILQEFNTKLNATPNKKEKVYAVIDFVMIYGDSYSREIIPILDQGLNISREIGFEAGEIICLYNLAFFNQVTQGEVFSRHISSMTDLHSLAEKMKGEDFYTLALSLQAYHHWFRGEYDKGFEIIFKTIQISDAQQNPFRGWFYFALAVFYFDTKDFENSSINYKKAFDLFVLDKNEYGKARSTNGMGTIAILQNRTKEAAPQLEYAAAIYRELGHYSGLSRALNDLGLLEKAEKNFDKAISLLNESIELRKEIDHVQGLITSYTELGETFLLMKDFSAALKEFNRGLDLAIQAKARQKQMRLYQLLYTTHKSLGDTEAALHNFENFFELKSQLLSDEASNNIKKIQTRFEKEKSEKETEIERLKNVELKKANAIIEQKNKDITDSINYARRIQMSILPSAETLSSCFQNYFVFYQPKDIVSGDFYWAVNVPHRKTGEHLSIVAAIDCTGHGVPGAFMSMLGNTLLNQTILNPEIVSPADVLNYLNAKLPENLKPVSQDQHIRDGMDMALCIFDLKNMRMQFAGANNPCLIVRDNELIEIKGDKQPVSASNESIAKPFSNHEFGLKKNDRVYLFTDGFADQFGGPRGKKYKYRQLQQLLLSVHKKPAEEQHATLKDAINTWRGDLEQVDDILVIGIMV
jgi:serine phosphatase RsbU (regulator of sigma subunit)